MSSEERLCDLLRRKHRVAWSVQSVRQVSASLRQGLASFGERAQVARVQEWLQTPFGLSSPSRV